MAGVTSFTEEMADLICDRLSSGESLRSVCRDESMPCAATVFKWLRENSTFSEQYARAKEASADALFEDIVEIADNEAANTVMIQGVPVVVDGKPVKAVDSAGVAHAKLRVDARKWAASKLKPKKYGERITKEHTGPNGGPIQTETWNVQPVAPAPNADDSDSTETTPDTND